MSISKACRSVSSWARILPIVAVVAFWGCSGSTPPAGEAGEADHSHEGSDHKDGDHDNDEHDEDVSALSAEDQALADAQKVCPVSGDELGAMGTPIKLDVNGQTVFVCCKGCIDPINEDPEKYLAKLGS